MDFVIADGKTTVRILPLVKFKNFDFNFVKDQYHFSLADFLEKCPEYSGKIEFDGEGMGLYGAVKINLRSGKLDDYTRGSFAFEYIPIANRHYKRKMSFKSGIQKNTIISYGMNRNKMRLGGIYVNIDVNDFSLPSIIRQTYGNRCIINLLFGYKLLKIDDYLMDMDLVNRYCSDRDMNSNDMSLPNVFEMHLLYGDKLIPNMLKVV